MTLLVHGWLRRPHTLIINRTDSRCGNCGLSADPDETHHNRVLGYNPGPGCGQRFVLLDSDYRGDGTPEAAQKMRPDLEWVGR